MPAKGPAGADFFTPVRGPAVLLLALVYLASPPFPGPSPAVLTIALSVLVLELTAVRQREFGHFSASLCPALAGVLHGAVGARVVALSLALGYLLRVGLRARGPWARRLEEWSSDSGPTLLALCAALAMKSQGSGLSLIAATLLFLGLTRVWAGRRGERIDLRFPRQWRRFHEVGAHQGLACCLLAPLLLHSLDDAGWSWVFLPILLTFHATLATDLIRLEELDLQGERQQRQQEREQSRRHLQETRQQLELQQVHGGLLSQLTEQLARTEEVAAVYSLVLAAVRQNVACDTVALFQFDAQGRWSSPAHHSRQDLQGLALTDVSESIVEEAWKNRQIVSFSADHHQSARLFPEELEAVALPLEEEGVLYVGRRRGPYQPQEWTSLWVIARQAALGIQSAGRNQAQLQALQQHREAVLQLQRWVNSLHHLLQAAQRLSAVSEDGQLLAQFQRELQHLIPHHVGYLELGEFRLAWPDWSPNPRLLEDLTRPVRQTGQPMVLQSPPDFLCSSLLVAPIWEEERMGLVLLGSATPYRREEGDWLQMAGVYLGSALRRNQLQALNLRSHRELEQAYARLAQSQSQIIQSSKLAAVGQLAAGVAHELNSPLAASVLQISSALRNLDKRPENLREKLELAQEGLKRSQSIIGKLLYYSREAAVGQREVDLGQLLRDTMALLRLQLEAPERSWKLQLTPDLKIWANENEVQQVVTNLLLNARDAVEGCASQAITVSVEEIREEVALVVQDSGSGVPPELREKIFDPFFTTKEVGKGTGLGLSVSREIMRNHGGDLKLEEAQGGKFLAVWPRYRG